MTRRRLLGLGVLAVVGYVAILGVTVAARDGVRPLYDGFAPPARYRFVDPPPFFAPGNQAPEAGSTSVPLRATGSAPVSISTGDGQVSVNLAPGAVPAHGSDRRLQITITPEDAAALGALPGGLRANGNAYRIVLRYEPSGTVVKRIERPGTLLVALPEVGEPFFWSATGKQWTRLDASTVPPRHLSVTTELQRSGRYLSGTSLPLLPARPGDSSSSSSTWIVAVAVGAVAVVLVVIGIVLARRRRRRRAEPPAP